MYTIIIDEAEDIGLDGVKADPSKGPTQYFTLCATVFDESRRSQLQETLQSVSFNKGVLHANKLSHFEKVHLCRVVAECPIGMLGVISNKLSLDAYMSTARKSSTHFYNKVMQYLLESVGQMLSTFRIPASHTRILIEAREQRYDSLLYFLRSIQKTPTHKRASYLRNIDVFSIARVGKSEDPCVAFSDLGANALFASVRRDMNFFGLSEARYLNELRQVFLAGESGAIVPLGVKPIHSLTDLGLPVEAVNFLGS